MNRLTPATKILGCIVIVANCTAGYHFTPLISELCSWVSACCVGVMMYLGLQPIPPAQLLKAQSRLTFS